MIEIKYRPVSLEELPVDSIKIETMEDLFKFHEYAYSFIMEDKNYV